MRAVATSVALVALLSVGAAVAHPGMKLRLPHPVRSTSSALWSFELGGPASKLALSADGEKVLAQCSSCLGAGSSIAVLDVKSGTQQFTTATPSSIGYLTSACSTDSGATWQLIGWNGYGTRDANGNVNYPNPGYYAVNGSRCLDNGVAAAPTLGMGCSGPCPVPQSDCTPSNNILGIPNCQCYQTCRVCPAPVRQCKKENYPNPISTNFVVGGADWTVAAKQSAVLSWFTSIDPTNGVGAFNGQLYNVTSGQALSQFAAVNVNGTLVSLRVDLAAQRAYAVSIVTATAAELVALDISNPSGASTLWTATFANIPTGDVVLSSGYVLVATDRVQAFKADTGAEAWSRHLGNTVSALTVDRTSGAIFVAVQNTKVLALNVRTGEESWSVSTYVSATVRPMVQGDLVIVAGGEGNSVEAYRFAL